MQSWLYGIHAVLSQLDNLPQQISEIYLQDNWKKNKKLSKIAEKAKPLGLPCSTMAKKQLDEMSGSSNHQGVICLIQSNEKSMSEKQLFQMLDDLEQPAFILILDQIQDPHNLGACLRTAAAAGVNAVIAPKDGAVSITASVRKVACGATETVPYVQVTNLARTIKQLKDAGIWITGSALETEQSIYDIDFTGSSAIVIGSEGKGMRRLVREHCDYLVQIPMPGNMESLNASVATGVCLFEVVRQRR